MTNRTNNDKVMLNEVRLSYPSLYEKAEYEGKTTNYQASFIVPKKSKGAKQAQEIINGLAKKYKVKKANIFCFKDGDDEDNYPLDDDGNSIYKGCWIIKGGNPNRPLTIDHSRCDIGIEDSGRFYAGVYVNAKVSFYHTSKFKNMICCGLKVVQLVKDGEPLGGDTREELLNDFDDISDYEGDDNQTEEIGDTQGDTDTPF